MCEEVLWRGQGAEDGRRVFLLLKLAVERTGQQSKIRRPWEVDADACIIIKTPAITARQAGMSFQEENLSRVENLEV